MLPPLEEGRRFLYTSLTAEEITWDKQELGRTVGGIRWS